MRNNAQCRTANGAPSRTLAKAEPGRSRIKGGIGTMPANITPLKRPDASGVNLHFQSNNRAPVLEAKNAPAKPGQKELLHMRDIVQRHRCRNPKCRAKLTRPVENEHHAFCTRGCHKSFYYSRCLVCEEPLRRKNERQRFGSGHKACQTEYRRFPHVYDYKTDKTGLYPVQCTTELRSAHFTGLKFGISGHPPSAHCLCEWWWGDPVEGDLSLYDKDGLALARLVLEGGRYHLRSPLIRPRPSWPNLEQARRGTETLALCSIPLDPNLAARIKRYNTTPPPMGPPLNRPVAMPVVESPSIAPADFEGDPLEIPDFLRKAKLDR
jgi:hypothetical protein